MWKNAQGHGPVKDGTKREREIEREREREREARKKANNTMRYVRKWSAN